MRTIRVSDFWRGVVLAPDDGSDTFLLLNVVPHDDAYTRAAKRLYTVNTATRALEVRNVVAIEQPTPTLERAAAQAPALLFAKHSDTVLRHLGIDDQVLRAVRTIIDKPQLDAFGNLLPTVTGRSSRLRINYRSTEEILTWSTGLLDNSPIPDLGGDGSDSLAGYRSLLHGKRPNVAGHPTEQEEVAALVSRVRDWLGQGVRPSEIAVCTRFKVLLNRVADELAAADIPTVQVRDQPGPDVNGVRLATMHAMKGLEFRCVAVLGVTAGAVPFAREVTPAEVDRLQHDADLLRERCVLFVACTRAREAMHVSWSGTPSPFLPG